MQFDCPHCHALLAFGDKQPSFCAFCGHALGNARPPAPVVGSEAATLPPPTPSGNSTGDYDSEAVTRTPAAGTNGDDGAEPDVVGGYRLLRPLGEGGMGTVYEAEDVASGRRVALKLIGRQFATSPETVERFRQEGQLASALVHPRCVFVFAADEEAGRPYIVMELMPGTTLQDLVGKQGPLPVQDAVVKIVDVLDGLQEAHQLGMIHRDVKPSNCFLEADGHVKIGDFGLAKSLVDSTHLTRTGSFLGTPLYASPEQIRADPLTPQTDVYSLAATLYFLLAGKAPFQSGDAAATLARIVADDPPPLRGLRPEVPEELDQVVQRGLARDRARRYRDLEELRQALRPFLPGQPPLIPLGLRLGAYLLDKVVLWTLNLAINILGGTATGLAPYPYGGGHWAAPVILHLLDALIFLLYFAPEAVWGASPGKALVGLRVCRATTTDPPGLWRGLLRALIFYLLVRAGSLTAVVLLASLPAAATPADPARNLQQMEWVSLLGLLSWALGIGLVCCTMRTRNGLRGLHDFATGTRVIRRLRPERRLSGRGRTLQQQVSRPPELAEHLGPYRIKGALRWTANAGTLLAEDPGLGRDLLLWLRPVTAPPCDATRRALNRTTRLRWLASGRRDDQLWDAFLAPSGCSLPALVEAEGPLAWPDARPVLEQLTEELLLACNEGTLPGSLSLEQVWVQANGRVLLLDAPLTPSPTSAGDTPVLAAPSVGHEPEQGSCLAMLGEVAALAVRGRPGPVPGGPDGLGAPLPLHAAKLLGRLAEGTARYPNVTAFQEALRATRGRPTAVTRARRSAHLLLQAVFLFLGLCCFTVPMGFAPDTVVCIVYWKRIDHGAKALGELERGTNRSFLLSGLNPDLKVRLGGAALLGADLRLQDRVRHQLERLRLRAAARFAALAPTLQGFLEQGRQTVARQREQAGNTATPGPLDASPFYRAPASSFLEDREVEQVEAGAVRWALAALLVWPALWVLWAFLARGGLSFRLVGLALVQRDGRPAARWRCAWRTLLVWAPVTGLLVASVTLDGWYWSTWTPDDPSRWAHGLSRAAWWAGLGLLAAYIVLALRSPAQALHDRLAGTFLVPR